MCSENKGIRLLSRQVPGSRGGVNFERLLTPHGSELWHIRRLRTFEGRPHSATYNIQEPELGRLHSLKI
jgi:hypothetical protein